MPRPEYEPMDYLTKRGRRIFFQIVNHIKEHDLISDIDVLELSMLANTFDIYIQMGEKLKDGYIGTFEGKNGSFEQVKPEYGVMMKQYDIILKHSSKYGLTPGDREKIFGGLKKKKKKDPVSDLD